MWSVTEASQGPVPEPWVSIDVIARHLGVAKDTVYKWIDSRGLPAHRIGRLWKCMISDVNDWVRKGGAAEPPSDSHPKTPDDHVETET
jgi:excisionase family DNA binding protein